MDIDERLAALTMNLELLSRNQEAMQARQEAMQVRQEAMQARQEAMQIAQADIHSRHLEMQQDIQILLRSQVLMSEGLEKLATRMTELAEAQRHTDQRMDALILTVDQIIRRGNG